MGCILRIEMFGATDMGRVRKNNQDSLFFNAELGLLIVADGIGGRKGGEVASSLAVNGIKEAYLNCESLRHEEVEPFLIQSIDHVNKEIITKGNGSPVEGMATTLNCILFVGEKAFICHMGDSRTYLYFKNNLWQLTLDHNVENYVERGWLPDGTLAANPKKGALVRALGLSTQCEVDIYELKLQPGEILLTCSDGLSGMVNDKKMLRIIKEYEDRLYELPQRLIQEANEAGGQDNITVVISHVARD